METTYLTKAEEQIMQLLWRLEKAYVKDLLEQIPAPKPAYNTVSTIVRILEEKGFIGHTAIGKSHLYYPIVAKSDYSRGFFKNFLQNYFGNSFPGMVSFFANEKDITMAEMEAMMDVFKKNLESQKANKK